MDLNASGFILDPSSFHSVYCQGREEDNVIDLGLSLRTLQPEAYHPSGQLASLDGYNEMVAWHQLGPHLKEANADYTKLTSGVDCYDETEGVESKERWAYVKVNMDGVVVGRKVCILDHGGFSSLVSQLEDMFANLSSSGLKLFHQESEFLLLYKDKNEHWRAVGDVPWKEFVDCVKRLRIARK